MATAVTAAAATVVVGEVNKLASDATWSGAAASFWRSSLSLLYWFEASTKDPQSPLLIRGQSLGPPLKADRGSSLRLSMSL